MVDEYGDKLIRVVHSERTTAAMVVRTHGAYLISFHGALVDDLTPDALYDAASSLTVAKRIARQGAADLGYEGPWRWTLDSVCWTLQATHRDESWQYEDEHEDAVKGRI